MRSSRELFPASPLVLLIVVLVLFFTSACDPSHAVTYDNETDMAITIYKNDKFSASLKPMEEKTFELIEFSEATFEATDSGGRVVHSETFTWEKLGDAGWRIVITESVQPSPTSSVPSG